MNLMRFFFFVSKSLRKLSVSVSQSREIISPEQEQLLPSLQNKKVLLEHSQSPSLISTYREDSNIGCVCSLGFKISCSDGFEMMCSISFPLIVFKKCSLFIERERERERERVRERGRHTLFFFMNFQTPNTKFLHILY